MKRTLLIYFCRILHLPFLLLATIVSFGQPIYKFNPVDEFVRDHSKVAFPAPAQLGSFSNSDFSVIQGSFNLHNSSRSMLELVDDNIQQQNRRLIEEDLAPSPGRSIEHGKNAEIEMDLNEDVPELGRTEWLKKTAVYRRTFDDLLSLNPDSFSITRAEYDIENAYLDNKVPYDKFLEAVKTRASLVKQILKRSGLKPNSDLALNYGIQQLYRHANIFYDRATRRRISIPALMYDFNDYNGERDLVSVYTVKLLATGKGQCLSLPRLYLMIAEQLGAKAWLSLAPQHSYIQFIDGKGRLMNFETTNGNLASTSWLAQSGFINARAVKNRLYLDTLSQRQLYAQCLADFLVGYLRKFGYDGFADQVKQRILIVNPHNVQALIIDANLKKQIALGAIAAAGRPKPEDLPKYPEAYRSNLDMKDAMDKIDDLGYQDMPEAAYKKWLRSMEQEKKKQANQELRARVQRQIDQLKLSKLSLQHRPKG